MVTTWQLTPRTAAGSTWALMMVLSSMDQLRFTIFMATFVTLPTHILVDNKD